MLLGLYTTLRIHFNWIFTLSDLNLSLSMNFALHFTCYIFNKKYYTIQQAWTNTNIFLICTWINFFFLNNLMGTQISGVYQMLHIKLEDLYHSSHCPHFMKAVIANLCLSQWGFQSANEEAEFSLLSWWLPFQQKVCCHKNFHNF